MCLLTRKYKARREKEKHMKKHMTLQTPRKAKSFLLVRQSEPEDMLTPETHEQKNKIEHRRSIETPRGDLL